MNIANHYLKELKMNKTFNPIQDKVKKLINK